MSGGTAYLYGDDPVEINAGRAKATVTVSNTGDRAIQVGSHYHFFEVNRALRFDRNAAYGKHLDIPAGTAVRFEPGDTKDVVLAEFGGHRRLVGFSNLVDGGTAAAATRARALDRAMARGFKGTHLEPVGAPEVLDGPEGRGFRPEAPQETDTPRKGDH
ncbi:urease subunit beta [Kitasatospora sp. NPDC094019]|uniref:urease subunit beta n=1 Tax=Kitasatospora sp. NPDC094019 TaxID=3364091 RepID=UPI00381A7090